MPSPSPGLFLRPPARVGAAPSHLHPRALPAPSHPSCGLSLSSLVPVMLVCRAERGKGPLQRSLGGAQSPALRLGYEGPAPSWQGSASECRSWRRCRGRSRHRPQLEGSLPRGRYKALSRRSHTSQDSNNSIGEARCPYLHQFRMSGAPAPLTPSEGGGRGW